MYDLNDEIVHILKDKSSTGIKTPSLLISNLFFHCKRWRPRAANWSFWSKRTCCCKKRTDNSSSGWRHLKGSLSLFLSPFISTSVLSWVCKDNLVLRPLNKRVHDRTGCYWWIFKCSHFPILVVCSSLLYFYMSQSGQRRCYFYRFLLTEILTLMFNNEETSYSCALYIAHIVIL